MKLKKKSPIFNLADEAPMKERIPQATSLKLKGAGPKIKTKDGSAVHLIELIKPNKEGACLFDQYYCYHTFHT